MNALKKSFLSGLVFSGTVFCSFLVYAATIVSVAPQTISTGDILGAGWVQDVNNRLVNLSGATSIPTGAIMAFNLSSCPSGWIAADGNNSTPNLRGEFVRGWDYNNSGVDNGRSLGGSQISTQVTVDNDATEVLGPLDYTNNNLTNLGYEPSQLTTSASVIYHWNTATSSANYSNGLVRSIRPRNVALLYCMKQ